MDQATSSQAILIAEDEALIRYDLIDFFEDRGFEVFAVENAESAIEALAENPWIPILLTDIQMPGSMNGIELAHHVRDRYPPMVIVVASGTLTPAAEELPERVLFVSKPFDRHHVLREMRRLGA